MKVISLWQPWASLWAGGAKRIETRSWQWHITLPQTVAVHASKRFTRDEQELCLDPDFAAPLAKLGYEKVGQLPLGCVVGVVSIDRVYQFCSDADVPDYPERCFGDYSLGRWGWATTSNRLLAEPIPLKGCQGPFDWEAPAELLFADGSRLDSRAFKHGAIASCKPANEKPTKQHQPTLFDNSEAYRG